MMAKFHELSVAEMLADPIVRALMAADGVADDELQALLRSVARSLRPNVIKALEKKAPGRNARGSMILEV